MGTLNGLAILVVDDEELLLDCSVKLFKLHGASAIGVTSGASAYELIKAKKFDVVIADLRMINGDGLNLLRKIRSLPMPHPEFVLCTGYDDLSPTEISDNQINYVITKPFDESKVIDLISRCCGKNANFTKAAS